MKKFLVMAIFVFAYIILLQNPNAYAKIVPVEAEDYYIMGDGPAENQITAKEQAYELAKRAAAEKFGVYVETHTEVVDSTLTKDKIISMAAALLNVTWHDFYFDTIDHKSVKIICKLKGTVDTSKITAENLLEKDQMLKKIAELEEEKRKSAEEAKKYKDLYNKATSENQKQEIQNKFNESQRQFLIAKYEQDIDIYDFGKQINAQALMNTAQKLSEIDPQNTSAFRATVYYYRVQDNMQKAIDYCKEILKQNSSSNLMIETCTQLGDIYYNELENKSEAKKFIDQGIALVKKQYTKPQIRELVNGNGLAFEVRNFGTDIFGKSNSIRELYMLKSYIEGVYPEFGCEMDIMIENNKRVEEHNRFYGITYNIDW